uniref:Uncharacterized protein n=1 Tax=Meloidogyne enterolobii TaxID=390850 RepID=A0A6V7V058_MELEN|nr:unnamed protein product [Meloidogyne enterolobii]
MITTLNWKIISCLFKKNIVKIKKNLFLTNLTKMLLKKLENMKEETNRLL